MPSAAIKKKIPCSKANLIKMVLDIEKYPQFVPWCLNSKICKINTKADTIEIIADLTIGKNFFKETYKSFIIYNKNLNSILVTNIDGPIKNLTNKWLFKDVGKNSEIDFQIDFELKNKFLNLLMVNFFDIGLKKIVNAFEMRAVELFKRP